MKKLGRFLKRILLVIVGIILITYAIITFFNQQKLLNTYATSSAELDKQIEEASQYNEQLNKIKDNVNSEEYIEEKAREKLDMYYPNERVYIDSEQ